MRSLLLLSLAVAVSTLVGKESPPSKKSAPKKSVPKKDPQPPRPDFKVGPEDYKPAASAPRGGAPHIVGIVRWGVRGQEDLDSHLDAVQARAAGV